jgi:hypothetical protein
VKLIYTNQNPILVGNIKNIVENSGIEVELRNEYASGGAGELSPIDTWPELWVVNDSDIERAEKLVQDALNPKNAKEWRCSHCHEMNDPSFDFCWKCHSEKPH